MGVSLNLRVTVYFGQLAICHNMQSDDGRYSFWLKSLLFCLCQTVDHCCVCIIKL